MTQDQNQLRFEAGRAAANRGWPNAQVVGIEALDDQTPAGPPLILAVVSDLVTTSAAKNLAAPAGAGRHVLLVTHQPLPDADAAWLPADTVLVIGQEPGSAPPGTVDRRIEARPIILASLAEPCVVAGNPSLPGEGIGRCSQDPDREVRSAASPNPSSASETRLVLLHDADPLVRVAAGLANVGAWR